MAKLKYSYPKVKGVEYNIEKRWENGINHHYKSIELMDRIANIDFVWNDDQFCWKTGGDGDNGESLMFILDIIFEEDARGERNAKIDKVLESEAHKRSDSEKA